MAHTAPHKKTDRAELVSALLATSPEPTKSSTERFLEGLASDELRYIAEFLGAGVVAPELRAAADRRTNASRIEMFESRREARAADASHKMILLLEFLTLARRTPGTAWSAIQGSA